MSLFLSHERLCNYLLKMVFWKATYGLKDRFGSKGHISKLMRIDLKPTERCNLHCPICGQWGDHGSYRTGLHKAHRGLPIGVWNRLIDEMKDIRPLFYIWGGEPLLYPDIIPLIKKIRSIGAPCFMVTNGRALEELAEEIVDASPDMLLISLDGPEGIHDTIRGQSGLYNSIISGLEKVESAKKKRGSMYPLIMTTTTLSSANQHSLVDLFTDLRERKVPLDSALIALPWMVTEEECRSYEEALKRRFSYNEPSFARGFVNELGEDSIFQLQQEVERLKTMDFPFSLAFFPDIPTHSWDSFLHQEKVTLGKNSCNAIYTTVQIAANGDVSSCRDFPDLVHGNIKEQSLCSILNNKSFCNFRKEIKKEYLPLCHKCCNLYEHSGLYFPALKL